MHFTARIEWVWRWTWWLWLTEIQEIHGGSWYGGYRSDGGRSGVYSSGDIRSGGGRLICSCLGEIWLGGSWSGESQMGTTMGTGILFIGLESHICGNMTSWVYITVLRKQSLVGVDLEGGMPESDAIFRGQPTLMRLNGRQSTILYSVYVCTCNMLELCVFLFSVYACTQCMFGISVWLDSVYTCTWYMLVLGVCLYSLYACTQCILEVGICLYSAYDVLGVCWTQC